MSARKGNVSLPVASLVGCGGDLAGVLDWIGDGERLVTITGLGGIGRTRLLREVLGRASEGFGMHGGGGAWFVDLSRSATVDEAGAQVTTTLGVRGELGRGLACKQRVLLGLDNLEQLGGAFAESIAGWLASAPALQIVTTTRVALGLEGDACVAAVTVTARGCGGAVRDAVSRDRSTRRPRCRAGPRDRRARGWSPRPKVSCGG